MPTKTCLRYPGGKFYGSRVILPHLNVDHEEYREPFIGGASIFLAKDLANTNWINDKDSSLINFYNIICSPKKSIELFKMLEHEKVTKKRYFEVLNMVAENSVEQAFQYFYLNRTSFSGIMVKPRWGYMLGSSVTPDKWLSRIIPVAEKMLSARITNLDFREVLNHGDSSVLCYIDPPYFMASKSIYTHEFSSQDHFDLLDILKVAKFKFVLSYENSPAVKEMYNWANIESSSWVYYMSEQRRQDGKELIIKNF